MGSGRCAVLFQGLEVRTYVRINMLFILRVGIAEAKAYVAGVSVVVVSTHVACMAWVHSSCSSVHTFHEA